MDCQDNTFIQERVNKLSLGCFLVQAPTYESFPSTRADFEQAKQNLLCPLSQQSISHDQPGPAQVCL
jgi:hypothetical protein